MKNIVIFVSGRGSKMEAIVRACDAERWNARVVAVVSDRPAAAGLAFARRRGIATAVVDHRAFGAQDAFDLELARVVDTFAPDIVALAGFMRILGNAFVDRFAARLVNIHPSLLPAFPGLNTHRRALEAGCKVAGATVHFVTRELDHGPIIGQALVPVLAGDSEESLAARVLVQEHRLYPTAISWLVADALLLEGGIVRHRGGAAQLLHDLPHGLPQGGRLAD